MVERMKGPKKAMLSNILSLAVKKKIWYEIYLAQVIQRLKIERDEIIGLLDELNGLGDIELKLSAWSTVTNRNSQWDRSKSCHPRFSSDSCKENSRKSNASIKLFD